jgi:hypothetical protein
MLGQTQLIPMNNMAANYISQSDQIKQYLMQTCDPNLLSMVEALVNQQIHDNLQRYQAQLIMDGVLNN